MKRLMMMGLMGLMALATPLVALAAPGSHSLTCETTDGAIKIAADTFDVEGQKSGFPSSVSITPISGVTLKIENTQGQLNGLDVIDHVADKVVVVRYDGAELDVHLWALPETVMLTATSDEFQGEAQFDAKAYGSYLEAGAAQQDRQTFESDLKCTMIYTAGSAG